MRLQNGASLVKAGKTGCSGLVRMLSDKRADLDLVRYTSTPSNSHVAGLYEMYDVTPQRRQVDGDITLEAGYMRQGTFAG